MLMEGKMSTSIVLMETMPMTAIRRASTTNVYGRRSASRTIHIVLERRVDRTPPYQTPPPTFPPTYDARRSTALIFPPWAGSGAGPRCRPGRRELDHVGVDGLGQDVIRHRITPRRCYGAHCVSAIAR